METAATNPIQAYVNNHMARFFPVNDSKLFGQNSLNPGVNENMPGQAAGSLKNLDYSRIAKTKLYAAETEAIKTPYKIYR